MNRPFAYRWLLAIGASVVLFIVALTALYQRAEWVNPEQHFAYTQSLRDLREIDTRIESELLANRLELSRNYDALTRHTLDATSRGAQTLTTPTFLADSDREAVQSAARALQLSLADKADLVDRFKRHDAVLRNSLAYFPVAATEMLDQSGRHFSAQSRDAINHYTRHVLTYARAPSANEGKEISITRKPLDTLPLDIRQRRQLDNLLQHGDVIMAHLSDLDQLIEEIFTLNTGQQIEALNRQYVNGHVQALTIADRYRRLLYALVILLAIYLASTFARLDRTRRSLEVAHREVSSRYTAQLAAEKQLKLHATAFLSAHDGITLTDASGNILDVNPAFSRITGYERSEVIGRNPRVLKSGRHDHEFYAGMWKSINESGNWRGEIWNRNKYGEIYPELLSISAVRDEGTGQLTNYVAVFADIARLKAQEKQLAQMAYFDALTELPNRTLLADRLVQGIAQSRRGETLMAICYLDLDGFKPINDTWGHEFGDKVLVEIANRLKEALRGGDTVARLGGDEFVLLLLGLFSQDECITAVERLLAEIAKPLGCLPEASAVSASIGITLFPLDDDDPDTLMRHADQAMYQAKQSGKNGYHIFDAEQDRSARTRYDRVSRIRQALENHELLLYYQPKVNMRQGKVVGAEALIRWNHPERGILPPIEFLPLIEDDELIMLIGDWVIETALIQLEAWRASGLVLQVSVNVAGHQLQAPEFVEKLKVALFIHPTVAHQLELEVLETAALEDVVKTSRVIDECRALGVQFSLDDFGTGYSSLTYLKRLPAETIKIDQSFVREILSDYNNLVIVQGVIGLANAFQRHIIAEGVETAEHGRLLMQLNCDVAQGYGIAKPMPSEQLADWVRNWQPDPSWQAIRDLYWEDIDYPMMIAEVEHRNWVAQLVYAINEGLPAPHQHLAAPQHCRFGVWYYGRSRNRHAAHPAYAAIEPPHRHVHELAQRMDELWRDGHVDAARALIPELLTARDQTLDALRALQLAVAVPREDA
jgi:diguanylate cyclase (GGDEF)-like protein/PAS domain S-box-containing protein